MTQTSFSAYKQAQETLGERQQAVLDELRNHRESMTNMELAKTLGWEINTITPRIKELRTRGLVSLDRKRPCHVTGRMAMAWKPSMDTLF